MSEKELIKNGFVHVDSVETIDEGYYIGYFNGEVIPIYRMGGIFYELSFDQSPDFLPIKYFKELK